MERTSPAARGLGASGRAAEPVAWLGRVEMDAPFPFAGLLDRRGYASKRAVARLAPSGGSFRVVAGGV